MEEKTIIVKQGSVGSFLRGIMIGAAVALLFAPRSGEETRGMLTEKGTQYRDKAVDFAKDTRNRAQTYISDTRDKIQNKMNDTMKTVRHETNDANRELKRELEIMEEVHDRNYNV